MLSCGQPQAQPPHRGGRSQPPNTNVTRGTRTGGQRSPGTPTEPARPGAGGAHPPRQAPGPHPPPSMASSGLSGAQQRKARSPLGGQCRPRARQSPPGPSQSEHRAAPTPGPAPAGSCRTPGPGRSPPGPAAGRPGAPARWRPARRAPAPAPPPARPPAPARPPPWRRTASGPRGTPGCGRTHPPPRRRA